MRKLLSMSLLLCFNFSAFSQEEPNLNNYKRSSLYTFMVSDLQQDHSQTIQDAFVNYPIPDKFNDHNSELRTLPKLVDESLSKKEIDELQKDSITQFLSNNAIAKLMVAKWFNRSESGGFNMDLIAARGSYNASDIDIKIARQSERGLAMVADAGEELLKNTFVVVNNFKYTNKEEVAKKASGFLSAVSSAASAAGASGISLAADATSIGVGVAGKGYVIKTDAHLYRLVWDEETAAIFYNDYWTEDADLNPEKVAAFENSSIFKLEYIGTETAWADMQSTAFTKKTDDELITIATKNAGDAVIAKLQRAYEVFRTKTPLLSGDPLSAKIGLKEGLEKGDKYEVLEQVINKEGKTEYKKVGVIKVEKNMIWDNRYMADEENPSEIEYTTFSGSNSKYYAGMLIRQIN
ncbi:hypothetical protein [Aequorivita antarctica]|uniref:Uncharacterized protein n=1 Tax=Aequorivita antarctica TaxID=153266 RepID=A0A5C6Z094_9FLAO|nr:hypothetical protein [Aequorivita antarctica]TXD73042.1 hypothetical protein ESU54_10335 [Aequorivita antarctica]SRX74551.1 hypothetical protein AEQU3_01530 [Aequorivita antarctica]